MPPAAFPRNLGFTARNTDDFRLIEDAIDHHVRLHPTSDEPGATAPCIAPAGTPNERTACREPRPSAGAHHARTTRLRIVLAILALAGAGCGINAVDPLPLDITITADRITAVPADSISFEIRAQGGNLLGIIVDWDDDTSYVLPTGGARTAEARVRHAYANSGVYQVSAAVDDAAGGRKTATLSITIE